MIDSLELNLSLPKEKVYNLSLPKEKVYKIVAQCQEILTKNSVSLRDLTQLIGRQSSTAQAVLPATIQSRYLQQIEISSLEVKKKSYKDIVSLDRNALVEFTW